MGFLSEYDPVVDLNLSTIVSLDRAANRTTDVALGEAISRARNSFHAVADSGTLGEMRKRVAMALLLTQEAKQMAMKNGAWCAYASLNLAVLKSRLCWVLVRYVS
jgi:hypothetical protein